MFRIWPPRLRFGLVSTLTVLSISPLVVAAESDHSRSVPDFSRTRNLSPPLFALCFRRGNPVEFFGNFAICAARHKRSLDIFRIPAKKVALLNY